MSTPATNPQKTPATEQTPRAALTEQEAARYIGMSVPYLRCDRMHGHREGRTPGPPFVKIGRSVRYLQTDLDAWLQSHRVNRTLPVEA